jgi:hypothetical protein
MTIVEVDLGIFTVTATIDFVKIGFIKIRLFGFASIAIVLITASTSTMWKKNSRSRLSFVAAG